MKGIVFCIILEFFFAGILVSCDIVEEEPPVVVDPCQKIPNCIPDISDWKLHFKPCNSDCIMCHTTCTPNAAHKFCDVGENWIITETKCLECHSSVHL